MAGGRLVLIILILFYDWVGIPPPGDQMWENWFGLVWENCGCGSWGGDKERVRYDGRVRRTESEGEGEKERWKKQK